MPEPRCQHFSARANLKHMWLAKDPKDEAEDDGDDDGEDDGQTDTGVDGEWGFAN